MFDAIASDACVQRSILLTIRPRRIQGSGSKRIDDRVDILGDAAGLHTDRR